MSRKIRQKKLRAKVREKLELKKWLEERDDYWRDQQDSTRKFLAGEGADDK